jgi:hypothetical protein
MGPDESLNDLYALRRVMGRRIDWDALLKFAIVEGGGVTLDCDDERSAGVDRLLAAAMREMFGLGELTAMASFDVLAEECRPPLRRLSASLIRLLDRAMRAHADVTGYAVDPWRESATIWAQMTALDLREAGAEENPLADTLRQVATSLAEALVALPRDRMDVPSQLAHALSGLLVVYAAARRSEDG